MPTQALVRDMIRTAGGSKKGLVGIPYLAGHIVGTEVSQLVPCVGHPVMADGEPETEPPHR